MCVATIRSRVTNPSPDYRQPAQGVMRTSNDRTITWITQPLPNGATLVAFMDVTAARKVEQALKDKNEALQAADKLKNEFVQNVSYQLRSPLTTILGYAELLESEMPGPLSDKQRVQVDSILSAADHLSKVIDNILDLAMIEAGKMELELSSFSLRAAMEGAVDLVVSSAQNTKVRVEILCDDRIGNIYADERRIKQVLFNLLSNALRFTGGRRVISRSRRPSRCRTRTSFVSLSRIMDAASRPSASRACSTRLPRATRAAQASASLLSARLSNSMAGM